MVGDKIPKRIQSNNRLGLILFPTSRLSNPSLVYARWWVTRKRTESK